MTDTDRVRVEREVRALIRWLGHSFLARLYYQGFQTDKQPLGARSITERKSATLPDGVFNEVSIFKFGSTVVAQPDLFRPASGIDDLRQFTLIIALNAAHRGRATGKSINISSNGQQFGTDWASQAETQHGSDADE